MPFLSRGTLHDREEWRERLLQKAEGEMGDENGRELKDFHPGPIWHKNPEPPNEYRGEQAAVGGRQHAEALWNTGGVFQEAVLAKQEQ
jgi:hypothetical protein